MKYKSQLSISGMLTLLLAGCVSPSPFAHLDDMETFILCQSTPKGEAIEEKISAEYGFKRFADNAYKPIIDQRLFGHEIRVVEMSDSINKVYVAGQPMEFAYNLRQLLPDIVCKDDICNALLSETQSLRVYRPSVSKSKDTTVIECTKAPLEAGKAE